MQILFENNHIPKIGKYKDVFLQDGVKQAVYVYDCDGSWLLVDVQGVDLIGGQQLVFDGENLSITGGNTVDLTTLVPPEQQSLTLVGSQLSISGGNMVDFGPLVNPANQTLSVAGTDLTISNGNTIALGKQNVGLNNVDNTSDLNKPISTATQTALNGKANSSHTHNIADINATGTPSNSNFLRGDGAWATPAAPALTFTGDATGSGTTSIALTLASTGVSPGSYSNPSITVDAKGRITTATSGVTPDSVFFNDAHFGQKNLASSGLTELSGAIDGSNKVFVVPESVYQPGTLQVYKNGVLQVPGEAITETDNTIGEFEFVIAPTTGDQVYVTYSKYESSSDTVMLGLIAGTNISVVDNGDGTWTINSSGGGGGGGMTAGDPVVSGTADRMLYIDTAGDLADDLYSIKPFELFGGLLSGGVMRPTGLSDVDGLAFGGFDATDVGGTEIFAMFVDKDKSGQFGLIKVDYDDLGGYAPNPVVFMSYDPVSGGSFQVAPDGIAGGDMMFGVDNTGVYIGAVHSGVTDVVDDISSGSDSLLPTVKAVKDATDDLQDQIDALPGGGSANPAAFIGTWSAGSNNINFYDGSTAIALNTYTAALGDIMRVRSSGTIDIGSGSEYFEVDDLIFWDGSAWKHVHGFTPTERTKLAGIASGATANSSDATLLARANHTGTQSADTITNGTTNKVFTATEQTKLAAISGSNTGDQTATTTPNTPAGNIAATTVQAALNELDTEKLAVTVPLASGKGYINHGAVGSTARGTVYASYEWHGTAIPANMTSADTWFRG